MAPLLLALRDAAGSDPEAAGAWKAINDRRARNMRDFVRDVGAAGGPRAGLSGADAEDTVWTTNSGELSTMLTQRPRPWLNAHYQRWLAETWRRLLLPD